MLHETLSAHRALSISQTALLIFAALFTTCVCFQQITRGEMPHLEFSKIKGDGAGGSVFDVSAAGDFDSAWVAAPSVVRAGSHYRMWYSSFFSSSDKEAVGGIGAAISVDGIHWTRENAGKPVLEVGGDGSFDGGQVTSPEVIVDDAIVRMWYTGDPGKTHSSGIVFYDIGAATSSDGIHFQRENAGKPVLSRGGEGSADEVQAATPSILKDGDVYRMWYAAWSPISNHTICMARSADGVRWEKENEGKPVAGLQPSIAYGHAVTKVGDHYLMLYQALKAERAFYAAESIDGANWTMLNNGIPVISPEKSPNAFDRDIVGHPFLLLEGSKLRVWYTGYQINPGTRRDWRLRIGLAEADVRGWLR
jgi:predicted GH43/DUF377 family glycosyl hydrolase